MVKILFLFFEFNHVQTVNFKQPGVVYTFKFVLKVENLFSIYFMQMDDDSFR